jgi:hypothetical protein
MPLVHSPDHQCNQQDGTVDEDGKCDNGNQVCCILDAANAGGGGGGGFPNF